MSAPGFELKLTTAADCAAISALHEASFPDEPWNQAAVAQVIALAGAFGFAAWQDGELCGFILARSVGPDCEVLALAVAPNRRRNGIGRLLVTCLASHAPLMGADVIHLEVAEDNRAACALYCAEGFQSVGRRPDYYLRPGGRRVAAVLYSREV